MIVASSPQHGGKEPIGELSARDAEILTFERQWWKFAGAKEQAIRDKFQMSATRYYQILNALIDKPEALAQDPLAREAASSAARDAATQPLSEAVGDRSHDRMSFSFPSTARIPSPIGFTG